MYCSSGAVYGQQPPDLDKISEDYCVGSVDEMAPTKRDYAAAKRDSENAIIELGKQGLSVSIARCFAFVGPYLPRNKHFAIGNFIEDGMQGRHITIKAQHEVYRSYMHADDLVIWLMTIAASSSTSCPLFNVGSDKAVEIRELAQKVASVFRVQINAAALISSVHMDRYIPNVDKAKNSLGLNLQFDLDGAISFTAKKLRRSI